jgi:hypothetical protein
VHLLPLPTRTGGVPSRRVLLRFASFADIAFRLRGPVCFLKSLVLRTANDFFPLRLFIQ